MVTTDRAIISVLIMINQHIGQPCPTRQEVIDCTGLPNGQAAELLDSLLESGPIEIEEQDGRRRMRVQGGSWTDWSDYAIAGP